ncbi:MAG: hypothetical protein JWL85_910 [Candidatus Saccharibacteria bacterium]|nr:hypothetical protein [Candidatus Saccharibacteria bacterium]
MGHMTTEVQPLRFVEGVKDPIVQTELAYVAGVACQTHAQRIAEIGFTNRYPASAFLKANPEAQVTSFGPSNRDELFYLQRTFPPPTPISRKEGFPAHHTLMVGDPAEGVACYARIMPASCMFDLIFINGGQDFGPTEENLRNLKTIASGGAVLVTNALPWIMASEGLPPRNTPLYRWKLADYVLLQTQIEQ